MNRASLLAACVVAPWLGFAASAYADSCHAVSGELNSHAVLPPECTSPIGLCTAGTFTGSLGGNVFFLGQTFAQLETGWVRYTSDVTVTLGSGDTVLGSDVGYIDANPNSPGTLIDSVTFSGGTGAYAGANGFLLILGTFDLDTGIGRSRYSGWVCTQRR